MVDFFVPETACPPPGIALPVWPRHAKYFSSFPPPMQSPPCQDRISNGIAPPVWAPWYFISMPSVPLSAHVLHGSTSQHLYYLQRIFPAPPAPAPWRVVAPLSGSHCSGNCQGLWRQHCPRYRPSHSIWHPHVITISSAASSIPSLPPVWTVHCCFLARHRS